MAYAEAGCDKCGLLLPKNELRDWQEVVETGGTSASYGTYADGSTKYQGPKTNYRVDRLKLCPDCYIRVKEAEEHAEALARASAAAEAERAARARQARSRNLLFGAIAALAAILVIGAVLSTRPGTSGGDQSAANGLTVETDNQVASTTSPDASAAAAPAQPSAPEPAHEVESSAPAQPAPVTTADPAPSIPSAPVEPDGISTGPRPTPENTPALSKAVADALDSGSPKPWSANGRSGEVTVGDERFYGGRPCRSFAYTVGGETAPTAYACAGLDGVWRPAPNFRPE